MESGGDRDINLFCKYLLTKENNDLNGLISKLARTALKSDFKDVETLQILFRVISYKVKINDIDTFLVDVCKYVVKGIVDVGVLRYDSENEIGLRKQCLAVLELSIQCLIIANEDDFCADFTEIAITNISMVSERFHTGLYYSKIEMLFAVLQSILNAFVSIELRMPNTNNLKTISILQSDNFHKTISDILFKCANHTAHLVHTVFDVILKVVKVSRVNMVLNNIWTVMSCNEISEIISLPYKLSILCGLADLFISKFSVELNRTITSNEFWEVVQKGLVSDDALSRKKGLYLLKRSIDTLSILNVQVELNLFLWDYFKSSSLHQMWKTIFILFEILEEKQAHLIIPILQSTLKQLESFELVHPSWILSVYIRLFSHDSLQVVKSGIFYFFKMDVNMYVNCQYSQVIDIIMVKLNNMNIFYTEKSFRTVHWSDLDSLLKEWFENILSLLINKKHEEFYSTILYAIVKVRWCIIPLFHVLHNMSIIPGAQVFDENQLRVFCDFLKEVVGTHNVFIRGAVQCAMLNIICKFTKKNVDTVVFLNTLGIFKNTECLCRGLDSWKISKQWILTHESLKRSDKIILELLDKGNTMALGSKARSLVLLFDCGLRNDSSKFKAVVKSNFDILQETHCRSYAPTYESDQYIELILHILKESVPASFSSDFELKNDPLVKSLEPYINEVFYYVKKRLFNICQPLHFDSVELYTKAFQMLHDNNFVTFNEGREIMDMIEKQCLCTNITPIQRFLALRITLLFIQILKKNKLVQTFKLGKNVKYHCLSVIEDSFCFLKLSDNKTIDDLEWRGDEEHMRRLVSDYSNTVWSIIHICIDTDLIILNDILCVIPVDNLIDIAKNAIESLSQASLLSILGVIKTVFPFIKNNHVTKQFLEFSWESVFELRKTASFWPSITAWIEMTFTSSIILEKEIQPTIVNFFEEILKQGEALQGLGNVLMIHLRQMRHIKYVKPLMEPLRAAMLFGPVPRRDQRIENDTCDLIRLLGSSYAVNQLFPLSCCRGTSQEVRATALALLIDVAGQRESGEEGVELLVYTVRILLARDAELSAQRQRYHANSLHHRLKHRILQTLLVLEAILADSCSLLAKGCVVELVKWSSTCLQGDSQQPSVRYQLEWLLIRSLLHSPHLLNTFWTSFGQASEERIGSICSFISVAYHLAAILCDPEFISRCVTEILPWCMAQHFNIRLYAQVVLQKLWPLNEEIANQYQIIRNSLTKSLSQGNAVRNADRLKNDFYFTIFKPLDHFSLETIFCELPRLSNVSRDEWIPLLSLQNCFAGLNVSIPLQNRDDLLKGFTTASWIVKATVEPEEVLEASALQKKFVPWKNMIPEMPKDCLPHTELVVVASLIDKVPNLGGLARSCEIFAVQTLVVPSLEYTQDKLFSTLSMSAEKHINIIEVKPYDLTQYLKEKKKIGYTLVGAEQTAGSVSLASYKFPKQCLILLGSEKEGIPVNLLPLLDVCVEVHQLGVVRSLNVHVTGALFLWEYTKQFLANS